MKRRPALASVLLVCGLMLAFLALAWPRLADTQMSWQGWLAFGLGCGLSLALAALLMGLLFHSSRSGADEKASEQSAFQRRPEGGGPGSPGDSAPDEARRTR